MILTVQKCIVCVHLLIKHDVHVKWLYNHCARCLVLHVLISGTRGITVCINLAAAFHQGHTLTK